MRQIIIALLLFTLSLFASIPPQITYNDQHQPLVVEYEDGSVITYTYDEAGNITHIETPQVTITKTYDALNRLKTVTDSQGTVTYDYDALGRQTKVTFSNGITTEYSYDSRNRITNIVHKKSDGTVLQSFAYTYDIVGNRTQECTVGWAFLPTNTPRCVDYTYNEVNQLTKEVVSNDPNNHNTTTTFSYDAVGNLLTKTINGVDTSYSYNENDQLTTQGSVTYTYDVNGNLVDDGTNSYEYDDKNRLIKVITPNDTMEYSYDANDNRIAKIVNGSITTYLIDANTPYAQVITESKANGTTVEYTYGNDLLSDGSHNFLTDALGSTRGLVDASEALTDSYAYTPYGELSSHDGNSENDFLFTGEQLDAETSNYYLRARYYSPEQARFISIDPFKGRVFEPITLNDYIYAGNNPVLYVDPSGEFFGSFAGIGQALVLGIRFRTFAFFKIRKAGMKSLGCNLLKYVAKEAATEGIYLVLAQGLPVYVGQSKHVDSRLKQHINDKFKNIKHIAARFHVPGLNKKVLRETLEQIVLTAVGGVDNTLNKVNPIGKNGRKGKTLNELIDDLGKAICKGK